jgi:hypothetical protein
MRKTDRYMIGGTDAEPITVAVKARVVIVLAGNLSQPQAATATVGAAVAGALCEADDSSELPVLRLPTGLSQQSIALLVSTRTRPRASRGASGEAADACLGRDARA